MDSCLEYVLSLCSCCGCYSKYRHFDDDLYEPLLLDTEREAVKDLLHYLNREYEEKPTISEERLEALCTLTYSENADLQRSAALCLAEISERLMQPISAKVMEPILVLMESSDVETQKAASLALSNFALCGHESNKSVIVKCGALPVLIKLLSSNNVEIQCNACGCITTLATSNTNKMAIVSCNGVPPLMALTTSPDIRVQRNAAGALLNLTHIDSNRTVLVSLGAVTTFLTLLQSRDTDIQYYCAAALSNLAVDEKHRVAVVKEGNHQVIKMLISLLSSPADKVKCQACFALRNLASDDENQVAIVTLGGLPHLHAIMRDSSKETLSAAIAALRNLSIHRLNEIPIVEEGFLEEITTILRRPMMWDAHCHAAGTLRNLAAGSKTRMILSSGALDGLISVFLESTSPVAVQTEVTAALAIIAGNDEAKQMLLHIGEGRVFSRLISLASCSPSREVQYNSAGTIGQLALFSLQSELITINISNIHKYLTRFLRSSDSNFIHIALWTIVHLLKAEAFRTAFGESSLPRLVDTILTSSHPEQLKQLAQTVLDNMG
ncbi:vacuolar protein 8 [Strongylocentrotus purpuratus]|uniref:Vacuolar protein 8 n=1 Tax=Strongylocentrotus purpuratus TaxID=7668 RepID=A0A7M7N454_STRPU|nr:vacuolar protein 8 [Strongylocentrotus purpuratus]XP_030830697.1 vacuolar protein 8 [Strongylocentrotus purpuratus]XP_030830698.1 vacuolar protein 8 [Strongylocentrotus purpuratus]XP_030830700.1 vacuolar protein 8 [Strongylocentrotus purpuratus]